MPPTRLSKPIITSPQSLCPFRTLDALDEVPVEVSYGDYQLTKVLWPSTPENRISISSFTPEQVDISIPLNTTFASPIIFLFRILASVVPFMHSSHGMSQTLFSIVHLQETLIDLGCEHSTKHPPHQSTHEARLTVSTSTLRCARGSRTEGWGVLQRQWCCSAFAAPAYRTMGLHCPPDNCYRHPCGLQARTTPSDLSY